MRIGTDRLLMLGCAALLAHGAAAATIHVDDDAPNDPGPNDPLVSDLLEDGSRAHPFDAIQEAIDVASDDDVIVVARGTYTGAGNHAMTIGALRLTIDGGEAATIDLGQASNGFTIDGAAGDVTFTGLTLRNGRSTDGGSAIRCFDGSSVTIRHCAFDGHLAEDSRGGAIFGTGGGRIRLDACSFTANMVEGSFGAREIGGGAIYAAGAEVTAVGCHFEGNGIDDGDDVYGGAVWLDGGSATFAGCAFVANTAYPGEYSEGGAVALMNVPAQFTACTFTSNTAGSEGTGGAISARGSALRIDDGVFQSNAATGSCAGLAGAIHADTPGSIVRNSTFEQNRAIGDGSCGGSADGNFGAIWIVSGLIEACDFIGNNARSGSKFGVADGGAGLLSGTYRRCRFIDNYAERGGALRGSGPAVIESCLFVGNEARLTKKEDPGKGGAIYVQTGDVSIVNSTFIDNIAETSFFEGAEGGAVRMSPTSLMRNCIARGNSPDQLSDLANAGSSNIEGAVLVNGNIDADPMFVDAANDDFRLLAGSPCIDAGSSLEAHGELDLDGQPRALDDPATPNTGAGDAPHPDMGAYEYQPIDGACAADLNASGDVDFNDVLVVLGDWGACAGCASDLNGDGAVTLSDLLLVLAAWGPCP